MLVGWIAWLAVSALSNFCAKLRSLGSSFIFSVQILVSFRGAGNSILLLLDKARLVISTCFHSLCYVS